MRPIALKGHARALTRVKYNREGDLILSSSKDPKPSIWYTENGERLGTLNGHNGVVWDLDISWDSEHIVTGSGDNFCMLWDAERGETLHRLQAATAVRSVGFSYSGQMLFYSTDARMNADCVLNLFDIRDDVSLSNNKPIHTITVQGSKITSALWSHLDDTILTGHENGEIRIFDMRQYSKEATNWETPHTKAITDLQLSKDQTMLLSASKDQTAKLFDSATLQHKKTYKSERPVNSASISPVMDHIVLGGGEEAIQVTQTVAQSGQFEAKFYHLIFEDEFARIKGHFGPINTLAFHPDGKSYASGAEDGYVRLTPFDEDYFNFEYDY